MKPTNNDELTQQGLLVALEVQEVTTRLSKDGFDDQVILAGLAKLAHDMIQRRWGQAAAVMWFQAMGENAAEMVQR